VASAASASAVCISRSSTEQRRSLSLQIDNNRQPLSPHIGHLSQLYTISTAPPLPVLAASLQLLSFCAVEMCMGMGFPWEWEWLLFHVGQNSYRSTRCECNAAASERDFSAAGRLLEKRRTNLALDSVNCLVFLNSNM